MADLMTEQLQAQYTAIELLYSEGKWSDVLRAGEALLAELPRLQSHLVRPRLELLLGHSLLYGLADLDGAEARYRGVLVETEEPVLREIAEQGLVRCGKQRQVVTEAASGGSQALGSEPLAETTKPESAADTRSQATTAQADVQADATSAAACGEKLPMQSQATENACLTSLAPAAAMPWLAELGMEPLSSAAEETLALLRDPDALPPRPSEVMEDPAIPAEERPEAEQAEPPLSREEMGELARGLLEVVLD